MAYFDRFSAEALIQALVGGGLPEHLNIILFDREIGWKLTTLQELGDLIDEEGGDSPFEVTWDDILGKPTEFPPEDHTHVAADITDFEDASIEVFDAQVDRIVCDEDFAVSVDEDFNVVLSES